MNHINIYTQILPLTIALVSILFLAFKHRYFLANRYLKTVWISAIVFFSVYAILMAFVIGQNVYLWEQYENGNLLVREKLNNDTARNFAFLTAIVYAFLIAVSMLIIGLIGSYYREKSAN